MPEADAKPRGRWSSTLALVVSLCVTGGCPRKPPEAPRASLQPPHVGDLALATGRARLVVRGAGARVLLADNPDDDVYWQLRVTRVDPRAPLVQAVLTNTPPTCPDTYNAGLPVEIPVDVERDALSWVTTRALEGTIDADGTPIALAAGTPLGVDPGGGAWIRVPGLVPAPRVRLPPGSVGASFQLRGTRFDGDFGAADIPPGVYWNTPARQPFVVRCEASDAGRVAVRLPCAKLDLAVAETPACRGVIGLGTVPAARFEVPAGTTALWDDGTVAGRVVEGLTVHALPPLDEHGRRCKAFPRVNVTLCFASEAFVALATDPRTAAEATP